MSEKEQLIYASLLHDIGKLVMRADNLKVNHQEAGIEFLKKHFNSDFQSSKILNTIKYHHYNELCGAKLDNTDIAYIVYEADNISAALDRRERDEHYSGFDLTMPLYSVFNILNDNNGNGAYELKVLKKNNKLIKLEDGKILINDSGRYSQVRDEMIASLSKMGKTMSPNALLRVLELCCTFVPSSTKQNEQADISLYNHLKTTAMIATNIYDYYNSIGINDYKKMLYNEVEISRNTNIHLLLKADISGIQNFIYNIPNEDALKNLRARSFYLELLTENIADLLLKTLDLTRANLIYSGGGAFQMLVPNTEINKIKIKDFITKINEWMIKQYKEKLYIAINYVECSANDLTNDMSSKEKKINYLGNKHRELSRISNYRKINRYTYEELIKLHDLRNIDSERECSICKTSTTNLNNNNICTNCEALTNIGRKLNKFSETFVVITEEKINDTSIEIFALNSKNYMSLVNEKQVEELLKKGVVVRLYTINQDKLGLQYATDIMYGGSESNYTLQELSDLSIGEKLLGVLRIDVDKLSHAFIKGFSRNNETDFRYNTISRSTTLSSLLTLFFKSEMRKLSKGEFTFKPYVLPSFYDSEGNTTYNINVVYSGGDDIFVVGPWNNVLEFAINLNKEFKAFTNNTLTLSAGFSVFNPSTPILKLANIVGDLESHAKNNERDSICLFNSEYVFKWNEFEQKVLTKLKKIYEWFTDDLKDKNRIPFTTNFFRLRLLIRQKDNNGKQIKNLAKIAYTIAKMQEKCQNKELCKDFTNQILEWCENEQESKYLDLAMMLAIYLNRDKGGNKNDNY